MASRGESYVGNAERDNTVITCRAKVSDACYDGRPSAAIYGSFEDGTPVEQTEDGTYKNGSVVCDPCYIMLGQPTNEALAARGL
jgi:hypothetical protein